MQESNVFDDEGETATAAAESVQRVLRKERAVVKAKTCLTSANKRLQMLQAKHAGAFCWKNSYIQLAPGP